MTALGQINTFVGKLKFFNFGFDFLKKLLEIFFHRNNDYAVCDPQKIARHLQHHHRLSRSKTAHHIPTKGEYRGCPIVYVQVVGGASSQKRIV